MTVTAIPVLDRTSPTFRAEVDTFFGARVPLFTTEINALATDLTTKQGLANDSAVSANSAKVAAETARDLALGAKANAETAKGQAEMARDAAAASAATIGTTAAFSDANPIAKNAADNTKQVKLDLSAITPGTTPVYAAPNKNGTLALLDDTGVRLIGGPYTPTAAANVDFASIFAGEFDWIECHMHDILPSANSEVLMMRFFVGGVINTAAVYGVTNDGSNGALTASGISIANQVSNATGSYPYIGVSSRIAIRNINSATRIKSGDASSILTGTAGISGGVYAERKNFGFTGGAITGVRFYWASGATFLPQGTIRFYGFKKA
ncbi:hypothetical protein [Massilia antarctica]|uniref:hypothetical protein n=1 Tax=Massilia antarctica TaxID=2765360 RepID=UPI0006BB9684|nr:hypothetical protein [Massilia sp. H27-R4]MCY0913259.1 hypothetical protein [Massilia sp. H27-R4]CUI07883.1 hypothetical protein BN2497_10543 [Janthinobacterium sp. CG23_2]CUU31669.1 hypothetical protein BN3177_10543 [Janthinobacterium sp. CG23_2]